MQDNKGQGSNLFPSSLLQNFTKNAYQPEYTLPLHAYRSASKIQSNHLNNNQTFSIQHRQLLSQTSRKKLQQPQTQFQQRYQQIQKILINENYNLKQQNQYLTNEIRRIAKKEKQTRLQLEELTVLSTQQEHYILKLEEDFSQLKDYIQQNIQTLIPFFQTNSIANLKSTLASFIEGISDILCLDSIDRKKLREVGENDNIAESDLESIDKEIQELSIRLQSIIKENNSSCREPTVRRECIQIAKQIKHLQNKRKTPRFYKQHDQFSSFDRSKSLAPRINDKPAKNQKRSRLSLEEESTSKKESSYDKFKYPKQIYSKVTHRRSGSKEAKLMHASSASSMVNKKEKH